MINYISLRVLAAGLDVLFGNFTPNLSSSVNFYELPIVSVLCFPYVQNENKSRENLLVNTGRCFRAAS